MFGNTFSPFFESYYQEPNYPSLEHLVVRSRFWWSRFLTLPILSVVLIIISEKEVKKLSLEMLHKGMVDVRRRWINSCSRGQQTSTQRLFGIVTLFSKEQALFPASFYFSKYHFEVYKDCQLGMLCHPDLQLKDVPELIRCCDWGRSLRESHLMAPQQMPLLLQHSPSLH